MIYLCLALSILLNGLSIWYVVRILRKFIFISENLSDLFLTVKSFKVFVKGMYSMDSYHGEPMIQELVARITVVNNEIERFREIFEYTLDQELEDELSAAEEEEINQEPLFYEST
tara:strand:- start:436 stop:780 length:345 start_codon:yes stop_codon:yes gene_type:complete